MILPAINMWIWQWAEAKKSKKLANKILVISIAVSLFAIAYIIDRGSLGVIPATLLFSCVILYYISSCDEWWQKFLVVLGICVLTVFVWFIKDYTIKIETDNLSDIVYMHIFKGLDPPIVKKSFIKRNGLPENIDVDYKEDHGNNKIVTLEYLRNDGKFYVVFINDNYNNGYIQYEPIDLSIASFLRDKFYVKEKPLKTYFIKIKSRNGKRLKIIVRKNNTIDSIRYYVKI
ncbi:MAG: hypothetical protein BA863_08590 [Desulfovibrio sp. S3730MH75]|nr:MAG: hypothetical protein BA863_08590 [Desulfovibrio sp. S3730MH75]